ncbi:hypothetical protein Acr_14g0006740 [Actinidia rufa]|uniref:Uncharacterized protein n=1 Tax=Actinidia rufa TaxID=165716 RepID=A0A7J0FQN8_9ERIC|nr:hypothetical protein Acr_14g0006740 [Actinidia rufa]
MRNSSSGPEKSRLTSEKETGTSIVNSTETTVIHSGFGSGGCLSLSRKRHARKSNTRADEEVYNLSSIVDIPPPITFNNDDLRGLHFPYDDALVVSAVIANFNLQRILIDNGSSADILFILAFERMKIGLEKLHPFHTSLVSFGGNMTHPLGWIKLSVTLGIKPHQVTVWQDFIVVDCPLPYNAILGRPTLGGTRAITSTYHLKMKFSTLTRVGEEYLSLLPLLTVPTTGEELSVYLSILHTTVSAVLIREEDRVSKIANSPRPDALGRLLKWSIKLSEFHIDYKPRMAIKAQALADFVVESTHETILESEATPPEMETAKE